MNTFEEKLWCSVFAIDLMEVVRDNTRLSKAGVKQCALDPEAVLDQAIEGADCAVLSIRKRMEENGNIGLLKELFFDVELEK